MYTRIIYEISFDKRERRIGSFKRYKTSVLLSPYYFKDIKLGSWLADAPWTLVAISIVCASRSQPQQTPSGLLLPLTPVLRRRGSYARAQCQRKREDRASEERGWWKDMRQHAARRARSRRVLQSNADLRESEKRKERK